MCKKLSFLIPLFLFFVVNIASAALYVLYPSQEKLLNDGKMHIFLCGTGDPEPGMQNLRKPACVAVLADNQFLLFDAGEGSAQTLGMLGLPIQLLNTVFITHWHSDHFGGLGQLINESWIRGRKQPLTVYGPRGVHKVVSGLKQAYALDAEFRLKNHKDFVKDKYPFGVPSLVIATKKGVKIYRKGDVRVNAFLVDHLPVKPAFGYRIKYKNCKIVISGDTRVNPSLADNAKNADVLINEVFSNALYQVELKRAKASSNPTLEKKYLNTVKQYHSDSLELAKMAEKAHVKFLVLTHLVPAIGVSKTMKKSFIAGMKKYYHGPIIVADDTDQIVLNSVSGKCKVKYRAARKPNVKVYAIPKG